ncbi:helix-turn-helix domain-containing protein [Jeotgalibacillus malaysiensis]
MTGKQLKMLRVTIGMKQSELARLLKVSQTLISLIENGQRVMTDKQIEQVNKIFKIRYRFFK